MLTSPWFPRGLVQRLACVYRVLNKCLPVTTLPSWELNDPLHLPHAHRTGSLHSLDLSLSAHQDVCVGGARCFQASAGMEEHLPEPDFHWGLYPAPTPPAPSLLPIPSLPLHPCLEGRGESGPSSGLPQHIPDTICFFFHVAF